MLDPGCCYPSAETSMSYLLLVPTWITINGSFLSHQVLLQLHREGHVPGAKQATQPLRLMHMAAENIAQAPLSLLPL